jgi:FdhE protein
MTQDGWLTRHPYLKPVAYLHGWVESAAAGIPAARPSVPRWDRYQGDFHRGVSLLLSPAAAINLGPATRMVVSLVERLALMPLPAKLQEEITALNGELSRDQAAPRRAVASLVDKGVFVSACSGLLRYLGWTILARHLRPVVDAFAIWRQEERWFRSYCPTCGSPPALAQLVGANHERRRFLSCGLCGTRWWYCRTGCPFCENENGHGLAVLAVQGDGGLRVDYCESCGGYLKTYDGQGSENVLLADWTSIHLDLIAQGRGLRRPAASLYEL